MPATKAQIKRRRQRAVSTGVTNLKSDFAYICKKQPDRIGIVAEGDSWFAYPYKWVLLGADINIVHHLSKQISGTDKVNLLRLASNGDEAVNMTSGKQFAMLYKILKKNQDAIDILLFSGGGNDIVGKTNLPPLLNQYQEGFTYKDCINTTRFEQKLDSVILAYRRLLDLCEDTIPNAKIVTHTYDIARPWNRGAEFFWGTIKTRPWIYPYLIDKGIPKKLHLPIVEYMLNSFSKRITKLAKEKSTKKRLIVVDTQGTLKPGSKLDWLNEIHPTSRGFNKVYKKIYKAMKCIVPELPN